MRQNKLLIRHGFRCVSEEDEQKINGLISLLLIDLPELDLEASIKWY